MQHPIALRLLRVPSQTGLGMLCSRRSHDENYKSWQLQTLSASCTSLLSFFFPNVSCNMFVVFFPPILLVPPLDSSSLEAAAEQVSLPMQCWGSCGPAGQAGGVLGS